ncbi:hypothetical protein GCM10009593_25460 [Microlunatus antarcticus]
MLAALAALAVVAATEIRLRLAGFDVIRISVERVQSIQEGRLPLVRELELAEEDVTMKAAQWGRRTIFFRRRPQDLT